MISALRVNMKSKDSHPPIKAYSDILTFGKHKGKTVESILDDNPDYLVWLVEEGICQVSDEIYNEAQLYAWADSDPYNYEELFDES